MQFEKWNIYWQVDGDEGDDMTLIYTKQIYSENSLKPHQGNYLIIPIFVRLHITVTKIGVIINYSQIVV